MPQYACLHLTIGKHQGARLWTIVPTIPLRHAKAGQSVEHPGAYSLDTSTPEDNRPRVKRSCKRITTMFTILLVPLDGSPQSIDVIDLASRVAAPGTATVHLLCVVDPSYALPSSSESGVASDGLIYPCANEQTSFARSVLAAAATQLADRDLAVEQHFCAGNPAEVVVEQARLLNAEVIVMGHHHLSRLRRWANPSTCGVVIEKSPCAVLIETREKGNRRQSAA